MTTRLLFVVAALLASRLAFSAGVVVDDGWLTTRDINIEIKAGSPLDFSALFPEQEGGISSHAEAGPRGELLVKGKATRFLCAAMNLTPPYGGFPSREDSDRYARQLRRTGYNMVRIHHIDSTLMTERKLDFDYDPVQLDRFHYFLAALKKQGIYWMLDAMSSENAAWGNVTPHRWVNRHDMKVRVHVDPVAQAHWKRLIETLYGRVNPHTGVSILQDPALLGLSFVNEGGLQFITHVDKKISPLLKPALLTWLRSTYPDPARFAAVWGQPAANLVNGNLALPAAGDRSPAMDDVLSFYDELQGNTAKWMNAHVATLGSKALTTAYNNMPTTHAARARRAFAWVDMHAYHDEGFGFEPGARIRNDSSFDKNLQYILDLSTARLQNRAFTVSEYGQPFWNSWRRESGLVAPAYAAFQDWGAICQHASTAVDLTYAQSKGWKQSIIPYAVGLDPVGRVIETLAALLYRRGDVATSASGVEIVLPGGEGEATSRYWGLPGNLARIALVASVSTRPIEERATPAKPLLASIAVAPEGLAGRKIAEWVSNSGVSLSSGNSAINQIARLQSKDNKTDAAAGIYESGTGQLMTNMAARRFEVKTPLTRGLVFEKLTEPWSFGPLQLTAADGPGLVALASLDNKPLANSASMLLMIASDALNTEMRFTDSTRRTLVQIGRLPARIEGRRLTFDISTGLNLRVSALRANGEVTEVLPMTTGNNKAQVVVNLSALQAGPSFYFHVERLDNAK
jgi:hypothetical protein